MPPPKPQLSDGNNNSFDSFSAYNVACAHCFEDPCLPELNHSCARSTRVHEARLAGGEILEAAGDTPQKGRWGKAADLVALLGDQGAGW